ARGPFGYGLSPYRCDASGSYRMTIPAYVSVLQQWQASKYVHGGSRLSPAAIPASVSGRNICGPSFLPLGSTRPPAVRTCSAIMESLQSAFTGRLLAGRWHDSPDRDW